MSLGSVHSERPPTAFEKYLEQKHTKADVSTRKEGLDLLPCRHAKAAARTGGHVKLNKGCKAVPVSVPVQPDGSELYVSSGHLMVDAAESLARAARSLASAMQTADTSHQTAHQPSAWRGGAHAQSSAGQLARPGGPAATEPLSRTLCKSSQQPPFPAMATQAQQLPGSSSFTPFDAALQRTASPQHPNRKRVGGVAAPSFPAYNPLVQLLGSSLAPPGTPPPQSRGSCRPASRDPITHRRGDWSGGSAAGSAPPSRQQRPATSSPHSPPRTGGAVRGAQVLLLEEQPGLSGTTTGQGAVQQRAVRASRLRDGGSSLSAQDLWRDDLHTRFNAALALLRDRVTQRGVAAVAAHFEAEECGGACGACGAAPGGEVDACQFRSAVRRLNLAEEAAPALRDDVLELLRAQAGAGGPEGRLRYRDFLEALSQGRVPFAPLDTRLRHRRQGDPDRPIGVSAITNPYAVMEDGDANLAALRSEQQRLFDDMRDIFQEADDSGSGRLSAAQFGWALRRIAAAHNAPLTDDDVANVLLDCGAVAPTPSTGDAPLRGGSTNFTGEVDYNALLSALAGEGERRFTLEFLKPKSMRCSTLGRPWEWTAPRSTTDAAQFRLLQ